MLAFIQNTNKKTIDSYNYNYKNDKSKDTSSPTKTKSSPWQCINWQIIYLHYLLITHRKQKNILRLVSIEKNFCGLVRFSFL